MMATLPSGVKTFEASDTVSRAAFNENWTTIDGKLMLSANRDGYGTTVGTATAYTVTLSPAPTLVDGLRVTVKLHVDNGINSTINVNGLGAKAILKPNGSAPTAGLLKSGSVYTLVYNGTAFILQGEGGEGIPIDVGLTPAGQSEQRSVTLFRKTILSLNANQTNDPFINVMQLTSDEANSSGKMYYNAAGGYVHCNSNFSELTVSGIVIVHSVSTISNFTIGLYFNDVLEATLFPATNISGSTVIPFSGRVIRSIPANTQFKVRLSFPSGITPTLRERAIVTFMGKGNWS